ncbi:MAG: hypothetical protein UR89_C0026G0003 [Candidatus Roizmanbacteria bacterium GW2011_GWA2_35_8]|uniref:Uncharacterized protein n=1 Tax=Candidatus Roizmanbacteria bacterium GW2011_GWA2_35_8 TaxID=1618479 RepID=A0A0G0FFR9_9BACT|nr:MAG: hypothetical protein UR89_C0026G0003 [Candidatus Roizmanbacteria bacterium GW2011_GWA2_35_8]
MKRLAPLNLSQLYLNNLFVNYCKISFYMNKITLSLEQVDKLIRENRYKVEPANKFISRCIDGRYKNEDNLPALAFPGADVGEIAMVLAASKTFGFDVDFKKLITTFTEVVGGVKNIRFHTDHHATPGVPAAGCGHFKQMKGDPSAYGVTSEETELIQQELKQLKNNGAVEIILEGEHMEEAVLMISGNWGINPQYSLETENGVRFVEVFVYHQTLVDERHKALCSALVKNMAITFKNGEDEEWLYNALFETSEIHLMETAKRLAKGLPIYEVEFNDNGDYKIR